MKNIWKLITFATFVLGWFQRAAADGVIDSGEFAELFKKAASDFELELDLPENLQVK